MNSLIISQISIVITYSCNLSCKYCFVHDKTLKDAIDIPTVCQAVEMWKNVFSGGRNKLGILFTGGEPLLKTDLILSIIDELENCYPEILFDFHITTNGLLLTDAFLEKVTQHSVYLCVSIDGNEVSNRERYNGVHGLYDKINNNIINYAKILDKYRFRIRMTITPENVSHFYENINYLVNIGVKNIHFSPNYEVEWSDSYIDDFFRNYMKLEQYDQLDIIIEPFHRYQRFGIEKSGPYEHDCAFLPTINTNGDVYFCPRFAGKSLQKLGHVNTPNDVLLNFRKLVMYENELFRKEGFSFICPSNYIENNSTIINFRKFYDFYKKLCM